MGLSTRSLSLPRGFTQIDFHATHKLCDVEASGDGAVSITVHEDTSSPKRKFRVAVFTAGNIEGDHVRYAIGHVMHEGVPISVFGIGRAPAWPEDLDREIEMKSKEDLAKGGTEGTEGETATGVNLETVGEVPGKDKVGISEGKRGATKSYRKGKHSDRRAPNT